MHRWAPPPFSCKVVPDGARTRVVVCGELDLVTVPEVDGTLHELRDREVDRMLLDLSGVTFTDSTGVSLVLRWVQVADFASWNLKVALNTAIQPVFELSGVLEVLRERGALSSAVAGRLQHEDLEGARRVEHDLAVVRENLPPDQLLHG